MSTKHKILFFLLAFIGVGFVLNKRSMEMWGAVGDYPLVPPLFKARPEGGAIGDIHKFYLLLHVAPDDKRLPAKLPVPDYVYDLAGADGDHVFYEMRGLPFLKLEGKSYELIRGGTGQVVKEWNEGVVLFWFGLIGTAMAAGFGVVIVFVLIARLFGYGGGMRD